MTEEEQNAPEISMGNSPSPVEGMLASPVDGASEAAPLPEYTMEDLPEGLRPGFEKLGWTNLMPVQARAIPYILANRDLMIQSRTGSGKTGAYLVPVMQRINPEQNVTQAMVLVPTRELALQVVREAEILGEAMNVRTVAVYGGVGYNQQLAGFRAGAHLVVGTPGRILDHLLRRSLDLDKLKIIIFDEADRMLSMGFYPDMKRIQRYLPPRISNSYMFSATFPPRVLGLSREFMNRPDFLNLSSDHVHVTEVQHAVYEVPAMDKERALIRIIEMENPASAIVFCNRRERVHFVATILQRYGYNAAEISSDLSQGAREEVMERIREGRLRFLVATDVASRGIDIPELSHVIMYEAPEDHESYIHRAGRTGRAGSSGVAISLVNALEKAELNRIGKRFDIAFDNRPLPTEEEVQDVIQQRTIALLEARLRSRDRLQAERMQRFLPFLREMEKEEESTALDGLAMLLDDFYHESFHTAQMPPMEESQPQQRRVVEGSRAPARHERRERRPGGGRSERGERGGQFDRGPRAEQGPRNEGGERGQQPDRGGSAPAEGASAPDSGGGAVPRRRRRGGRSRGGARRPETPSGA